MVFGIVTCVVGLVSFVDALLIIVRDLELILWYPISAGILLLFVGVSYLMISRRLKRGRNIKRVNAYILFALALISVSWYILSNNLNNNLLTFDPDLTSMIISIWFSVLISSLAIVPAFFYRKII